MDLATLDLDKLASDGVRVELTHPGTGDVIEDDKGKPLYIICDGRDSKRWKSTAKKLRAKNAKAKGDSMEAVDDLLIKIMAECTSEWSESMELDGEKLECNRANALKLYQRFGWIAEQVINKATDRSSLFLEHSAN